MGEKKGVTYFSESDNQGGKSNILPSFPNSNKIRIEKRTVYFGEWPQTIKNPDVTVDESATDHRGYYRGSDGEFYEKVIAKPYYKGYTFSDKSEIVRDNTYYFKVEQLKWTIIKEEGKKLLIHCDNIVFNKSYQSNFGKDEDGDIVTDFNDAPPDTYASNYYHSEIRDWLINVFLPIIEKGSDYDIDAFRILDYNVSESKPDVFDKVFLLCKEEVENYGTGYKPHMRSATDYAKACGAYVYGAMSGVKSRASGKGWWWLRTPCSSEGQDTVHAIDQNGVTNYAWIWVAGYGIVPALYIEILEKN